MPAPLKPWMPALKHAAEAWSTPSFPALLQDALQQIPVDELGLHRGTGHGGMVDDKAIRIMLIDAANRGSRLHARVGVFFTEIVINCGCGDDPYETPAFCELDIAIEKTSGDAAISVAAD